MNMDRTLWYAFSFIVVLLLFPIEGVAGVLKDKRDGKTYKTVVIGFQEWMAENLNYKTRKSWCYNNKKSNCDKYGRLYTWWDAMDACPNGWRLPNDTHFEELISAVGGSKYATSKLKSKTGWSDNGNGEDSFGFAVKPAGNRNSHGDYRFLGECGYFWTSPETEFPDSGYWAFCSELGEYNEPEYGVTEDKYYGLSVRCVKE